MRSITSWEKNDWQSCWKEGFIACATKSKYVEKQKLEFAIEQLNKCIDMFDRVNFTRLTSIRYSLKQKLSEL